MSFPDRSITKQRVHKSNNLKLNNITKTGEGKVKITRTSYEKHLKFDYSNLKTDKIQNPEQGKGRREETHETVIINGIDILLLGDHVAKAAAGRILEGNARGFRTQNPIDVVAIVELVIETLGDVNDLRGVTVLNNDEMVRLEKGPPHLQKIKVSDGGYHYIELIFQQGHRRNFRIRHFQVERDEIKLWVLKFELEMQ